MVVDAQAIEANVLFTTSGALVDCVDSEWGMDRTLIAVAGGAFSSASPSDSIYA
jgi:hypothetical protein